MPDPRAKILIIDDLPANIHVLREALAAEYDILFATTGQEGIELAQSIQPDLILLDVMMPGMDGYEVCGRLKQDVLTRDVPIVFVTALDSDASEMRGLELGAADYITKPINIPITRARVRNQVEFKRARDRLKTLGDQDGLTGIANRRRLDQVLDLEWRRCQRNRASLALIMVDVDHFKQFNDSQGHLAGDDCLKRLADLLAAGMQRSGDLAARYGGEEFACVLPDTDLNGALLLAGRLRADFAALGIPHPVSPHRVASISCGVAACVPEESATPRDLVSQADQQLYAAKAAGRNRVMPLL